MSHKRSSINRPPTPDVDKDRDNQEPTLQEIINIKLIESGEKERLKELLRERLIECGWRDEMKALCRAYTRKKGRSNVTVDDLVHVITPKGRGGCLLFLFCLPKTSCMELVFWIDSRITYELQELSFYFGIWSLICIQIRNNVRLGIE
ncbi:hypothetical protein Ddye_031577 [Dipteronia dyeriana]|uniref:Transcription and mRNA export factor ENY2 n=1 Tax=Dipteronia dyeriana TaxID=168575 RepID=A0AAD9TIK6_9ROSI|nr:hypothetical protein Ddye_031577 [Dipteronia dyeriana]